MASILYSLFQKTETDGTLPYLFYEASLSLIPKSNKDITIKENYRSRSLTDAKTLNKILSNLIQQWIKRVINHNQGISSSYAKVGSIFESQLM